MKRDMDLIRGIALAAMRNAADKPLTSLAGVDSGTFAAHVQWMQEAGLVHAALSPENSLRHAAQAVVFRLTWDGCEFADAASNDTIWARAKEKVIKPGMSFTFSVLTDWLKTEITQGLASLGKIAQ